MKGKNGSKYGRMFIDVFVFGVGMVLAKIVQFLLMPLYTSYMSVESYGNAELINNLSDLFLPIATLCVYKASFRYAVNSEFNKEDVITSSLKVWMISAVLGGIITFLFCFWGGYRYVWFLYAILYSFSLKTIFSYYIRGKGYSKIFASSGIINALALAGFTVFFLIFCQMEEEGYLFSIFMAYLVTTIYLFCVGKIYQDIKILNNNRLCLACLLKFGTPLILYNIGYWFTTMLGRYILLWYTDSSTVGLYVAAIKISAVINMMQQATQAAFELNASKEYGNGGEEKYYSNLCNIFCVVFFSFGAIIIALSPLISYITLKNEFAIAEKYLPFIMLGAIIQCLSALYGTMYIVYKCSKRTIAYSVLGILVNVGVSILLVPYNGIWGICIASFLCYFSQFMYKIWDIKKFCKMEINKKLIFVNIFILMIETVFMTLGKQYWFEVVIVVIIIIIGDLIFLYNWIKKDVRINFRTIERVLKK